MPAPHRLSVAVLVSLPFLVHATREPQRSSAAGATVVRRHAHGDVSGIVVRMTRGGAVSGRLVDPDGAPLADAEVRSERADYAEVPHAIVCGFPDEATRRVARTGADGRFVLPNLRPTGYTLVVDAPGLDRHGVRELVVLEGHELDLGDVVVPRGGTIVGTLRAAGEPIAGCAILLEPAGYGVHHHYEAESDASGTFRIERVAPGRYLWSGTRPDGPLGALHLPGHRPVCTEARPCRHTVEIADGETLVLDLAGG